MSATKLFVVPALCAALGSASADPVDPDHVSDVAERAVQSVVNISWERDVDVDLGPFANDPWFNDPNSPFYVAPDQRTQHQQSLGSGVIVEDSGRILTNAHVVSDEETVKVTLSDGTELDGKVIGTDPASDLAVVQLQGELPTLQALPIGDSTKLRLAEPVIAIGNPFGVGQAVTMGIVSAQGRGSLGIVDYEDFIQTDAAINPGNSGGALIDLDGNLVGINTAIASRSGGYEGIGFAIPTAMAAPIMKMLVEDGKVVRGYIGVTLAPLTRAYLTEHEPSVKRGVVVASVEDGGRADQAGLEADDVITAIDGVKVTNVAQLRNAIAMKGAGKKVSLDLIRGKTAKTIEVKTAELPVKKVKKVKKPKD
jgi:serine protease Do